MKLNEKLKHCYLYFNVYDLKEKINTLTEKERYLITLLATENHNPDDNNTNINFSYLENEIKDFLHYFETYEIRKNVIKELINDLDKYLNTTIIELPKLYTKEEIREIKLKKLFEN